MKKCTKGIGEGKDMGKEKCPQTLAEIEELPQEILTCSDIAGVLKADPYSIHKQATTNPEWLGFPVVVMGNRVKIPKQPFLSFMRGESC